MMAAIAVAREEGELEERQPKFVWVKPWLSRKPFYGQYDTLMIELMRESAGDFKSILRVTPEIFRELCDIVCPLIRSQKPRRL